MVKVGWFCDLLYLHAVAIYSHGILVRETSEACGYGNGNELCKINTFAKVLPVKFHTVPAGELVM